MIGATPILCAPVPFLLPSRDSPVINKKLCVFFNVRSKVSGVIGKVDFILSKVIMFGVLNIPTRDC
jgi:hypothetical protein